MEGMDELKFMFQLMRFLWRSKQLILTSLISLILGLFVSSLRLSASPEGVPYLIWDKTCFVVTETSRIEEPMVDGKPDRHHARFVGFTLPEGCARIEIKHLKEK